MTTENERQPTLQSVVIARSDRGFEVRWQRDGRPTRRELTDLGGTFHLAYQAASLSDSPVIDLTGGQQ